MIDIFSIPGSPPYDSWNRGNSEFKLGSNSRLEMTSPSEANFDEAALEAELEALHMSRCVLYSVFHRFRQANFANGGLILSLSHFLILPRLPQKLSSLQKVVKIDSKIIISLPRSKSVKLTQVTFKTHYNIQFEIFFFFKK
jgi:hypothetical protein